MNLKRILLFTTVSIATVIGSSSGARATSVSYTSSTFSGITPYSQNLAVNQFDTSLGTLTGISITVSAQASADINVYNPGTTDLAFTNASSSSQVVVSTTVGSSASVAVQASTTDVSGTATAGGISNFNGTPGAVVTSGTATVAAADFGLYEGTGSGTVDINVAAGAGTYSGTGTGLFFGGSTTVASYVTVTYEYTAANTNPAAVPEPTSSAIFGIGIVLAVGLGWGRKRRELRKLAV
jgi:hypothetical protein